MSAGWWVLRGNRILYCERVYVVGRGWRYWTYHPGVRRES